MELNDSKQLEIKDYVSDSSFSAHTVEDYDDHYQDFFDNTERLKLKTGVEVLPVINEEDEDKDEENDGNDSDDWNSVDFEIYCNSTQLPYNNQRQLQNEDVLDEKPKKCCCCCLRKYKCKIQFSNL